MVLATLACLGVILYLCVVYLRPRKKGRLPTCLPGIPLFGNALQFEKRKCALQMAELGTKFGDAFTLKLFDTDSVVLNSYDLIKEALSSPEFAVAFSGRPSTFAEKYLFIDDELFATYSDEWAALRKLMFRGLKTYGSNMADVEELVQGEIQHLLDRIQNEAGTAVDPIDYINAYITSIISMLITGRHLNQDDEQLRLLAKVTGDMQVLLDPGTAQLLAWLPWLRLLPFGCGKMYKGIQRDISELQRNIKADRLKPSEVTKRKPCFLDFMYEEQEKGHVTENNVTGVVLDILASGTLTTRTSMYSLLLAVTAHQDIQRRIQEEIEEVVGRSRLPCSGDKNSMPYTQAVLWETFRLYPAAPLNIPRCTMKDVQIRDYFLPKDTQVFYNIWLVLHDKKFWKDPYVFNPSRFLDDTGNLLPPEHENRQRMVAFGVGKRLCVGETLARLRIFLALSAILQKFTLKPDPDNPLPDTDPRTFSAESLLFAPKYNIVFESRNLS